MRIKIFDQDIKKIHELEREVNSFIQGKTVVQIQQSVENQNVIITILYQGKE